MTSLTQRVQKHAEAAWASQIAKRKFREVFPTSKTPGMSAVHEDGIIPMTADRLITDEALITMASSVMERIADHIVTSICPTPTPSGNRSTINVAGPYVTGRDYHWHFWVHARSA